MLDKLLQADRWLFAQITTSLHHPFLDAIAPVYRDGLAWTPLYLFLMVLMVHNYGWRVWPWIVSLLACAALCDQASAGLLKPLIGRLRPCEDSLLEGLVNLGLVACPDSFSFPSSHATSFTGIAAFLFYTLRSTQGRWALGWWVWAMSVSLAQVYVGIHYPLDVVAGSLLGLGLGSFIAWVFNHYIQLPALHLFPPDQPQHSIERQRT